MELKIEPLHEEPWWLGGRTYVDQHRDILAVMDQASAPVVMLGDSITEQFGGPGRRVIHYGLDAWHHFLEPIGVVNAGISGDKIPTLIWRLNNGILERPAPQIVHVLIGTNHIEDAAPRQVAEMYRRLLETLRDGWPSAQRWVHPILPRSYFPFSRDRKWVHEANLACEPVWKELADRILNSEGCFVRQGHLLRRRRYQRDGLHVSAGGYWCWAQELSQQLHEAMHPADQSARISLPDDSQQP